MNGGTYDIDGVPTKIGYQVLSRHDCLVVFLFVFLSVRKHAYVIYCNIPRL